ncbi:IclR family transcriptional regulator [Paenarthrobacter nicotinovorans]|uniref:IclR family transcriptional regulator n=1 Tax=Paenarthrobacter nicotinovorans TaxID=29320 RepID=UPI00068861FC|nr:IclR family transcriptional regulator [Paenarthrobacter nicotinovorans]
MSTDAGTESARRVADILIALGDAYGPIGVNELARRAGLSPTVAHRILRALMSRSLVAQNPASQQYSLGLGAAFLSSNQMTHNSFRDLARPMLERLGAETGQTATLSVLGGLRRMYVDQVLPDSEMKMSVELGRPYGLHLGSTGRAILAGLPDATIDDALELSPWSDAVAPQPFDKKAFMRRVEEVRQTGVAVSRGERIPGAAGVAAAIHDETGRVTGAVNILGPVHEFTDVKVKEFRRAVIKAASNIEETMAAELDQPAAGQVL